MTGPTLWRQAPPPTPNVDFNPAFAQVWFDRAAGTLVFCDETGALTTLTAGASPRFYTTATTVEFGPVSAMASPPAFAVGFTDASGVDNVAGDLTIGAPRSTGMGTPAQAIWRVGVRATASGSALHTLATYFQAVPYQTTGGIAPYAIANVPPTAGHWEGDFLGCAAHMIPAEIAAAMYGNIGNGLDQGARRAYLFHNSLTFGPGVVTRRALGTGAAPLVVTAGAVLGTFQAAGYDGNVTTQYSANVAAIRAIAAETFSSTNHGTNLDFAVTAVGAATRAVVATLSSVLHAHTIPVGVASYLVAALPVASATLKGAFACVTDATLTAITGLGLAPTGGGANFVPVYCDGTQWLML